MHLFKKLSDSMSNFPFHVQEIEPAEYWEISCDQCTLYTLNMDHQAKEIHFYGPPPFYDGSTAETDLTYLCRIRFDKDARKFTLKFDNRTLEIEPVITDTNHDLKFQFKTSGGGDFRWEFHSGLFSVNIKGTLETEDPARKHIVSYGDGKMKFKTFQMERNLLDEIVLSWFLMMRLDKNGYIH